MPFGDFLVLDKTCKERNPGARGIVPAVVLTRTEAHRTTLKGHEATCVLYSRYHPTCRDYQAAIPEGDTRRSTNHVLQRPVSLSTRILQQFDDVSLMAAQGI